MASNLPRAISSLPWLLAGTIGAELPLDDFLLRCRWALRGPVLFALDQFEEYFQYHAPSVADESFDAKLARRHATRQNRLTQDGRNGNEDPA